MKRRNPHLFRNRTILIGVALGVFLASKLIWQQIISPVSSQEPRQQFKITQGETTSEIAQQLKIQGLIRSVLAFKILIKLSGPSHLEAGDFLLSPSESTEQIIDTLSHGTNDQVSTTLLEGWRDEEEAALLNNKLGINAGEFLKQAKEGYMFPDTYAFNPHASVEQVTSRLEGNFNQKYSAKLQVKIIDQGLTPEQGVTLASIVEREGRTPVFKQQVASILLKRLKINMALDVDSTVQYALGYQANEGTWWKKDLTANDKKVNSPYNTYLYPGLPPGPICNPGLSSLEAVANADSSTPYLYYYNDAAGNAYFARTLDEHNQNIAQHP